MDSNAPGLNPAPNRTKFGLLPHEKVLPFISIWQCPNYGLRGFGHHRYPAFV
jgi:hypothetical protein